MRKRALFLAILLWSETAGAVDYTGRQYRDPFSSLRPEATQKKEQPKVFSAEVEGILWNAESPMAILSGKVVRVGSRIGEAEVIRIERDGVTVRVNGEEKLLSRKGSDKNAAS